MASQTATTTDPRSSAGLILRAVGPSDGEAIHALLAANIPGILEDRGRWLRRWRWQYWDNPFRGVRPAGWVLTDGERIVGHLGAVYVPFRTGPHEATAVICADYAVSPDALARGGMFAGLQLARIFFEAAADCIPMATTANDKTTAVFTRFGCSAVPWTREFWRAPATVAQQIRTCRGATSRFIRGLLRQPGGRILAIVAGQLYRAVRHRPMIPLPLDCRMEVTTPRLACDLSLLADQVALLQSNVVGLRRNASYFQWRYSMHPERANLRVLMLRREDGPAVAAAIVFFEDRGPKRIAFVEDLIAPADRPDTVRTLLCAALRLACDQRADFLVTMTGRQNLRGLYWELGFESRARSAPAAVIRHEPNDPGVLDGALQFWHGAMF